MEVEINEIANPAKLINACLDIVNVLDFCQQNNSKTMAMINARYKYQITIIVINVLTMNACE